MLLLTLATLASLMTQPVERYTVAVDHHRTTVQMHYGSSRLVADIQLDDRLAFRAGHPFGFASSLIIPWLGVEQRLSDGAAGGTAGLEWAYDLPTLTPAGETPFVPLHFESQISLRSFGSERITTQVRSRLCLNIDPNISARTFQAITERTFGPHPGHQFWMGLTRECWWGQGGLFIGPRGQHELAVRCQLARWF